MSDLNNIFKINIKNSSALPLMLSKFLSTANIAHVPGAYLDSQIKNHNDQDEKYKIKTDADENKLRLFQDQLENHLEKPISLPDLKNILEIYHPFHMNIFEDTFMKEGKSFVQHLTQQELQDSAFIKNKSRYLKREKKGLLFSKLAEIGLLDHAEHPELTLKANIYHYKNDKQDPEVVGNIQRNISIKNGTPTVTHELFRIDPKMQDTGFAKKLLQKALVLYKKKFGMDHVSINATNEKGAAVWSKLGGVFKDKESYLKNNPNSALTKDFSFFIEDELRKKGFEPNLANFTANQIITNAGEEQKNEWNHDGKLSSEELFYKLKESGLEPYKIANTIVNVGSENLPLGFDFLKNKTLQLALPLDKKSEYAHSFPLINHRFKIEDQDKLQEEAEVTPKTKTITAHVKSSPALDSFKQNFKKVTDSDPAGHIYDQLLTHNLNQKGSSTALFDGEHIKAPDLIHKIFDNVKAKVGKNINLSDLKGMYEIEHPYETHTIEVPENIALDKDKMHFETKEELDNFLTSNSGKILGTKRGVIYPRMADIYGSRSNGVHRIETNGNIYHTPIDDHGNLDKNKTNLPDYIGGFNRQLMFNEDPTQEDYAHHDMLQINDDEFKNKNFGTAFYNAALPTYRKLGLKHIDLQAGLVDGAVVWAKKGAVFGDHKVSDLPRLEQTIIDVLKDYHEDKGHINSQIPQDTDTAILDQINLTAKKIKEDLVEAQRNILKQHGKTDQEIADKLDATGIDPFLLQSIHISDGTNTHPIGENLINKLYPRGYFAKIPIHPTSQFGHGYPFVSRKFPVLKMHESNRLNKLQKLKKIFEDLSKKEETTYKIKVHVKNSNALQQFKKKYGNLIFQPNLGSKETLSEQLVAHNANASQPTNENFSNSLLKGDIIDLDPEELDKTQKFLDSTGRHINLDTLKDSFESNYPYEVHEYTFQKPRQGEQLPSKMVVNNLTEFLNATKHVRPIAGNVRRGIIFNRLTNLYSLLDDKKRTNLFTQIYHHPIDQNGDIPKEESAPIGSTVRGINFRDNPEDNHLENIMFRLNNQYKGLGFGFHLYDTKLKKQRDNLGMDHIKLQAGLDNGAQAWAKRGAILDLADADNDTNWLQSFSGYLKKFADKNKLLNKNPNFGVKIIDDLVDQQKKSLAASGMDENEINHFLMTHGVEPHLISGVKVNLNGEMHHLGHNYLYQKEFSGIIPLHANSKYNRSFPIIEKFHKPEISLQESKYKGFFLLKKLLESENEKKLAKINVHIKSSPALDKVKSYLNSLPKPELSSSTHYKDQIDSYNKSTINSPNKDLTGSPIGFGSSSHAKAAMALMKKTGANIDFNDIVSMYNRNEPYEIHTVEYDPKYIKNLPNKTIVQNPNEFLSFVDQVNGNISGVNRGIISTKVKAIHPPGIVDLGDERSVLINGENVLIPFDKNGDLGQAKKHDHYKLQRLIRFMPDGQHYVKHQDLVLPVEARNTGYGTNFFNQSLPFYKKMGMKEIALYAGYANGAQAWARRGAVHKMYDPHAEQTNDIFHRFELELPDMLAKQGIKNPEQQAKNITNDLVRTQIQTMEHAGHTSEEIMDFLDNFGVDPYLIYGVKVKTPNGIFHAGHEHLAGKRYDAAIPLDIASKHNRSLPYVEEFNKKYGL